MPLRRRIGLLAAVAVGITVLAASLVTYAVVRSELLAQVDGALTAQADLARRAARDGLPDTLPVGSGGQATSVPLPPPSRGAPTAIQVLGPGRAVVRSPFSQVGLPVSARDRAVQLRAKPFFSERHVGGSHLRVYTFRAQTGVAVQLARSVDSIDRVLNRLRLVLAAVLLSGVVAGGALGRLFAGRALRPVVDLTDAIEHVELTGDVSPHNAVDDHGRNDELGRLARRFNAMLGRLLASRDELDSSVESQRRLVADASHELRTPVTSLRTNAEVLRAQPDLPVAARDAILDDIVLQAEELGLLVSDLIELARETKPRFEGDRDEVRLDELVGAAVDRAQRHAPTAQIVMRAEPAIVSGDRERVARAVNNLLDNAVRHGPPEGPVEVRVTAAGEIIVRDHGPGIAPGERQQVFERFWRGPDARARPGSGLGLAIVRQVAEGHGGSADVDNHPDGGAVFRLCLPLAE